MSGHGKYWIWATEAQSEMQARIHGRPAIVNELGLSFDSGVNQSQPVPNIEIRVSSDAIGVLTDNLIAPGTTGLLFNSRLRTLLLQNGVDNIEYFPATLFLEKSGDSITDYMIANVIGCIACVSGESELLLDKNGQVEFIDRLVLDEQIPQERLMFRLAEYRQIVIVHEYVKNAIEAAHITGVKFYRPEEYVL